MSTPLIRRQFRYVYNNTALILIMLNVAVFFLNYQFPRTLSYFVMDPRLIIGRGFLWQFVTYMFAHAGLSHIFFNMLALFIFGVPVERRMGSNEFLLFYLLSGTLAGIFSFIVFYLSGTATILLGASGAVFAVMLAFATYYPDARIFIMGIIPVKSTHLVIGYTLLELYSQITSVRSGVAHLTHLAGFGFAFLYFILRLNINPVDVFRGGSGRWR